MKNGIPFLLFFALILSGGCTSGFQEKVTFIPIDSGWEFRAEDETEWLPATVPGSVHTDLFAAGRIEDPFYRLNEHDLQWIDKKNWVYRCSFMVPGHIADMEGLELHFSGLDTYADVSLNGEIILNADNMFREWSVNCSGLLRKGANMLEITLRSPIMEGLKKHDALDYTIPVSDNDLAAIGKVEGEKKVSIFTRKAGYHFGWDWGPRLVTSGIWKPVTLKAWNRALIRDVQISQDELTTGRASLTAGIELEAVDLEKGSLEVRVNGEKVAARNISENLITHHVDIPFEILDPKLWWPNGSGDQHLYSVEVVLKEGTSEVQTEEIRIGLRTVELSMKPDEIGASFTFVVNGRPIFMKGANYIPQDVFLDRVTTEQYAHILQSAADANMNMIRVWGGGIYEKDIFYDLCDEKGLLVWQDFMFACSMYPGDSLFLDNVRQEAIDNVKRLRNHPSIALWCGNNENLSAWLRWGWRERVIREQGQETADLLWKAYEDVFHRILPEVVAEYDGSRCYWSSSPSKAMGVPEELTHGDVHYWGVWWGKEPFETFRQNTGRFMSEYGFQSFPEMKTIEQYALPEDYDIRSEVMKSHQRSSIGNETIELYMLRDYREPVDFESFIYVGQVLQGEGIKKAIQLHRSRMPVCMGSLYWQLDDCWPVASWSGMDYYGRWKALQYKVKDAFKHVILAPDLLDGTISVSVVSDLPDPIKATMHYRLLEFDGSILKKGEKEVTVAANSVAEIASFNISELPVRGNENGRVMDIILQTGEEILDQELVYFVPPKALELEKPEIGVESNRKGEAFEILLTTNRLAKNVYLQCENMEGFFSDNYFDMLPGKDYLVMFHPAGSSDERPDLSVISLVDSYIEQ